MALDSNRKAPWFASKTFDLPTAQGQFVDRLGFQLSTEKVHRSQKRERCQAIKTSAKIRPHPHHLHHPKNNIWLTAIIISPSDIWSLKSYFLHRQLGKFGVVKSRAISDLKKEITATFAIPASTTRKDPELKEGMAKKNNALVWAQALDGPVWYLKKPKEESGRFAP